MKTLTTTLVLLACIALGNILAQAPQMANSSEIELKLRKLNVLGSALYVAAHPDDENTRMITYLSNDRLVNTAYLSMTRGDGGQNLIGPEIREGLGIIRTQELLAARDRDGGKQFFTRANDFGYSKTAEETLRIWEKDKVLSDVVWTIRKFRPDVIICRFPPNSNGGHGHHTSSAILAQEAFDIAGDAKYYPEQLKYVEPWQPKRILVNTGRWWNQSITEETPGVVTLDVGAFNPLLGSSYSEIASESRSQHKSQGFGSSGSRGEQVEYLQFMKGEAAETDLFEGVEMGWSKIKGGEKIGKMIDGIIENYSSLNPSASVPALFEVRDMITSIKDDYWKSQKLEEVDYLIKSSLGLFLQARAGEYAVAPGSELPITFEAVNRSTLNVHLNGVRIKESGQSLNLSAVLKNNIRLQQVDTIRIPSELNLSGPYWLNKPGSLGMYEVEDPTMIGMPENDPALQAVFSLTIEGHELELQTPVEYRWTDRVKGELYRPLEIIPPVTMSLEETVYVFAGPDAKEVKILVKSGIPSLKAQIQLELPEGWKSEPESHQVSIAEKMGEREISFMLFPSEIQAVEKLKVVASFEGQNYSKSIERIQYDHIPTQTIFPEAESKIVRLDISKRGEAIGYIMGAGDDIPASLEQIGYSVWIMQEADITDDNLAGLDAVILGVRALNTNPRIKFHKEKLIRFVENGGNLIVQYNTTRRLNWEDFSPYKIGFTGNSSDSRVSVEEAEIRILSPSHEVLNKPNKINQNDFDGWVQERGLYFPSEWAPEFTPILSSNDPGEDPRDGGLIVAKHGKGNYIYTGYSWFRQLPAGVPGAYRLFANIISLGKDKLEVKVNSGK